MARKILLADDSVTAQNMGRKILADAGYEVVTVNNGSAALKKIAEQKPDLIVLDVYMPGYSGLEVCQRLKEAQETARVPVLLTVGKLEPFKPEEAKRVRADGFIVKPFEASELLSALSKLEDKIVPRAETSKPGRFARVTASIEEGRYDKSVAIKEDSGWKDRISFPSKQKNHSDEPITYNAASRGVPKVIEHKLADNSRLAKAQEDRVDLGALAPEGLPKDVTPEEIAALAAAAAQVKGKIAETKSPEQLVAEAKTEQMEQTQSGPAFPATFTEHKSEEKSAEKFTEKIEEEIHGPRIQAHEDKPSEAATETGNTVAASPMDVLAAIGGLGSDAVMSPAGSSGNGFPYQGTEQDNASEPVTMARAGSEASRWTAVSVGLDPEEAAISLEHEMQKAYAAFAAAESGYAASVTAVPEVHSGSVEFAGATESSTPPEAPLPVVSIPALANASTDAIRAAVQELEMVAESYLEEPKAPAPQSLSQLSSDEPQPERAQLETAKSDATDIAHEEPINQEQQHGESKNKEPFAAAASAVRKEGERTTAEGCEAAATPFVNVVAGEQTSASQVASSELSSQMEGVAAAEPSAEVSEKAAKRDSEAGATPAAAWASWRRIRESGDPNRQEADQAGTPQAAAMAVAAGAEKTPEEMSAESDSDPAAIANIVDSVLADLRPKIFEEISRKMGKKK